MKDDALDALIATAKAHDLPPEDAEDQAWAAFVGAAGGGPPIAEITAAAKGATVFGLGAKGIMATTVLIATFAVAGVVRHSTSNELAPSTPPRRALPVASIEASPEPQVAATRTAATPVPTPTLIPATQRQSEAASSPQSEPSRTPRVPDPTPSSASTLAAEARLVGSMWKALARGDAAETLVLAKSHARRFNQPELRLEARAAALAARCTLARPVDLNELDTVLDAASPAVARRLAAACERTRDEG